MHQDAYRETSAATLRLLTRAESLARDHLRLTVSSLPERQALQFSAVRVSALDLILDMTVKRGAANEEAGGAGGGS